SRPRFGVEPAPTAGSSLRLVFASREGNMSIRGRQKVPHRARVFLTLAAFVQPILQMLACGGGELRKEQTGTSLVAGPDHVGMAMKGNIRSRQQTAKGQIRTHGQRIRSLNREPMLSDINR